MRPCLASGEPFLALVEETGGGVACFLVISDDFNVRRREQEDLVGHALDASAETEDEAGGEVDKPLGVRLPMSVTFMMTGIPSRKLSPMSLASL